MNQPRLVSDAEAKQWAAEGSATLAAAWLHDKRHAATRDALLAAIETHQPSIRGGLCNCPTIGDCLAALDAFAQQIRKGEQ
jgi:hypothetical protein